MIVLLWLPTMSMPFKLTICIDLPYDTLQAHKKWLNHYLAIKRSISMTFLQAWTTLCEWICQKAKTKWHNLQIKLPISPWGHKRNAANKLFSFCSVVAAVVILKDTKDSDQEHMPLWIQGTQFCPVPLHHFSFHKSKHSPQSSILSNYEKCCWTPSVTVAQVLRRE